jgi:SAM-dependent methyltransferase
MRDGIARSQAVLSATQAQTKDAFGFIWSGEERFQSEASLTMLAEWYKTNYGEIAEAHWWSEYGEDPILVDVGCGAGISALGLFGERLRRVRYVGVDVSSAVEAAKKRFADRGLEAAFLQTSLMMLPFPDASIDIVYAQGVLHHTDSTAGAITAVAGKLKPGGRLLFYVYRRKGPIREFTDDHVRAKLQGLAPDQMWQAMLPLTKFGRYLGELNMEIEVPESIALLDIPAGRVSLQRFFYWHVFKAFYNTTMTLEELNHVNLDWYAPLNAHRQSPEDVRAWCGDAGLAIEREHVQESGISIVARKQ